MEHGDRMKGERVSRETLPTIAFTAKLSHKRWIEAQAALRKISKSEVIREAIDAAMTTTDTDLKAA